MDNETTSKLQRNQHRTHQMRIILASIVALTTVQIGMYVIDNISKLQDAKMQKLCTIDSTYCKKT